MVICKKMILNFCSKVNVGGEKTQTFRGERYGGGNFLDTPDLWRVK